MNDIWITLTLGTFRPGQREPIADGMVDVAVGHIQAIIHPAKEPTARSELTAVHAGDLILRVLESTTEIHDKIREARRHRQNMMMVTG